MKLSACTRTDLACACCSRCLRSDEKGQLVGASADLAHISQQKRTEEALRRNERLATAGRLTAAIAHEIRNPLEALINLVYLARRDAAGRDEYLRLAEQEIGPP